MTAAAQLADTARHTGTALNATDSPRTLREAFPVFLRHGSPRILIVALAVALVVRLRIGDWSWSPDGVLLATAGAAAAIVWPFDGDDGPMTRGAFEIASREGRKVSAVAWRPGPARSLAIGWDDGAVQLASFDEPQTARTLRAAGRAAISSIAWNGGGTLLAFGSAAGECGALKGDA